MSNEFNKRTGLTADGVYSYEYHVKLTENGYDIIEDHVTKVSDGSVSSSSHSFAPFVIVVSLLTGSFSALCGTIELRGVVGQRT